MNVLIGNKRIRLDQRDVLGVGGEGMVFKQILGGQQVAIKVYAAPTKERGKKLKTFLSEGFDIPAQIAAPQELIFDEAGNIIGFTMPLLPKTVEDVRKLSSRKFRRDHSLTTKNVADIFLDGIPSLIKIHQEGLVVGDLNDLNVLYQRAKMFWIDVDSWQFGKFACPVATEHFVDPALYGIDLDKSTVFSTENDWYSYAAMLFKSLLLVHPYGGVHKTLKSLLTRAQKKVTVFDASVTYPKIALSPDILDDDLADVFDRYFAKGWRGEFPQNTLKNYAESLTECAVCGIWYPQSRLACPRCSERTILIVTKPSLTASEKGVLAEDLITSTGQIIFVRVKDKTIRSIAYEQGKTVLYSKSSQDSVTRQELFSEVPGAKFELLDNYLVVNLPENPQLNIFSVEDEGISKLKVTTTEMFAGNKKAVFGASGKHLFRIARSTLLMGEFKYGKLVEKPLRQVVENQTWFSVDEKSPEPRVFGLFQVFREQMFWFISASRVYELNIPQLETAESLLDLSVKFASDSVLLFRHTQDAGVDYIRMDIVDEKGNLVFSQKSKYDERPYPEIHGQVYSKGFLLHPTDDGVVQEKPQDSAYKTFTETRGFVDGSNTLHQTGAALLVVKEDKVTRLKLN